MIKTIVLGSTFLFLSTAVAVSTEFDRINGQFFNRSSTVVDSSKLRFAESGWKRGRDNGFAFALQRNTDYFYLWLRQSGAPIGKNLYCDGHLVDKNGVSVPVDDIDSFAILDTDGDGSMRLAAETRRGVIQIWNLTDCHGKSVFWALTTLSLAHPSEAQIVAGDFEGQGRDEIIAIDPYSGSYSQWRLVGDRLVLAASGQLQERPGSSDVIHNIRYITVTRLPHSTDNVAYESGLLILHENGVSLIRDGTAVDYAPNCRVADCKGKTLLFDLDQGFSDGLQDMAHKSAAAAVAALDRMIVALNRLRSRYAVWALLNPIHEDRHATQLVLDRLASAKIPFVLDLYSSDVTNLADLKRNWIDYTPRAFDPAKGISLDLDAPDASPDGLDFYVRRYGKSFAGVRFMERLGMDIQARMHDAQQMIPFSDRDHDKLLFDKPYAERVMNWADRNQKVLLWFDPALYIPYACYWKAADVALATQIRDDYVQSETDLARRHTSLVPFYDDNEGVKHCGVAYRDSLLTPRNFRFPTWSRIPRSIASKPGQFGLSVQSWSSDNDALLDSGTLPVDEMIAWTLNAFVKGAQYVEFEPYTYFFNWPPTHSVHALPVLPSAAIGDARTEFDRLVYELGGSHADSIEHAK
jgi:hypothetical protein